MIYQMNPKHIDLLAIFFVLVVGLLINWSGLIASGFWWTDEARHAMHGAFFVDFFRDMPLSDPYGYVKSYFAQYPALAFNWYLPLLPFLMGLVMLVFGVSEFTAHATIVFIWLFGVIAWYYWLLPRTNRWTALTVAFVILTAPVCVLWGRSIMLEAPAVGMCMASVLFFQRYLDCPKHTTAITAGMVIMATLLIKQTTLFILPVLLVYVLTSKQRHVFWKKESWWGIGFISLSLLVIAFHALLFGPDAVMSSDSHAYDSWPSLWTWTRWFMYTTSIYKAIGPILFLLMLIGIGLSIYYRNLFSIFPLAWLIAAYIWCTYLGAIPDNNVRYAFYAMPAIAIFSTWGIWYFQTRTVWYRLWLLLVVFSVGWHLVEGISTSHRYVDGYEKAAEFIYQLPNTGAILFAGKHDGNFIFHLRAIDKNRQRVVLRGDKVLLEMSVTKEFGIKSHVSNTADVKTLLDKNWVRWIVVESKDLVGLKEFKLLYETIKGSGYRLVGSIPTSTNLSQFKDVTILVYKNLEMTLPPNGYVQINYPYLAKTYSYTFEVPSSR